MSKTIIILKSLLINILSNFFVLVVVKNWNVSQYSMSCHLFNRIIRASIITKRILTVISTWHIDEHLHTAISLEGHEDETDSKTDADQHQQYEQTHVNASFYSFKSTFTASHCLRWSRSSQRRGSSSQGKIAGRRQGASDVRVISQRTNMWPWVWPWEHQRVCGWRSTSIDVIRSFVSVITGRIVVLYTSLWLVEVIDGRRRDGRYSCRCASRRRTVQRRRTVAVHLTKTCCCRVVVVAIAAARPLPLTVRRSFWWRHYLAVSTSVSALRVTWPQAEPNAARRHRNGDQRQRIKHWTRPHSSTYVLRANKSNKTNNCSYNKYIGITFLQRDALPCKHRVC